MSLLSYFRTNKKSVEEEIYESICDLLNTRKSFDSIQNDLGLDTYIYLSSDNQSIYQIIDDMKACINKYEKRVVLLNVKNIPSNTVFTLSFEITCTIKNKNHTFRFSFEQQKRLFIRE